MLLYEGKSFTLCLTRLFRNFFMPRNVISEWHKPDGQYDGNYENTASAIVRTIYRNVRIDSRGHVAQRSLLLLATTPSSPLFRPPIRTEIESSTTPPSTNESTPWHPTAFADSATQRNQDGYRVSTLSLRESSQCIHLRRYIRKRSR